MLTGVHAVNTIIATHHGPWLCRLHRTLKARQIYFMQSTFIDKRIDGHAIMLLIVHGKMLQ